jgi:phosphate-selective porin OprO/OprP
MPKRNAGRRTHSVSFSLSRQVHRTLRIAAREVRARISAVCQSLAFMTMQSCLRACPVAGLTLLAGLICCSAALAQPKPARPAPVVAPEQYDVAVAQSNALEARLAELEQQLAAQAEEHEQFRTSLEAATQPAEAIPTPRAVEVGQDKSLKGKWDNGFIFETPNKDFRMQIGGRTQIDAVWLQSDATGLVGAGGVGEADAVAIRRARLTFRGTMYETQSWTVEYDFVNSFNANTGLQGASEVLGNVINVPAPTDLWWAIKEVPFFGTITIGNHKEPLGMEHLTSSRFLDWMERSYLQDAYTGPFNNGFTPGISFHNWTEDERITWNLGGYKSGNNVFGFDTGDGEYAATGRLTCLPYYDEASGGRYLVHFGLSATYRDTDEGRQRIRSRASLRNGPGALNPTLADTGTFFADNQTIAGAELAAVWGSLHLQGEYMASINREAVVGGTNIGSYFSHGGYAEALYFLTGEHRAYDKRYAAFGRRGQETLENAFWVRSDDGPLFGKGAWQLGVRYNRLDLRDDGLDGGLIQDVTVGLNWFWNPNLRLQSNYIYTMREAPGGGPTGHIQGFGMRMAHDF